MVVGAAAYMAPEQARGQTVDKRADIWAFGVVVYELLTGRKLFEGPTVSDTIAAVLTREPDLRVLPPRLRRLVAKCLTRDVRQRLRDISGAALLLEEEPSLAGAKGKAGGSWGWVAAGVLALALAVVSFISFREPRDPAPLLQTSILLPEDFSSGGMAISPDNKRVAFVGIQPAKRRIWVRDLDSTTARALPGTESGYRIFWSRDARSIAFCAAGELKRIDIAGGPPVRLADCPRTGGGTWNQNGVILVALGSGLVRLPATGGEPVMVVAPPEGGFVRSPHFLPDGEHFLYTEGKIPGLPPVRGSHFSTPSPAGAFPCSLRTEPWWPTSPGVMNRDFSLRN
jgi:protein kinase-like protein/WD40 repeat protein